MSPISQTQINGGTQIQPGTITDTQIASGAGIADSKLATSYTKSDGTRAFTGDQSMGSNKLTNLANGVSGTDAVNVNQLTAAINGQDVKPSVRVATTTAGTLSSSFANGSTIDGVTLATGDSILIKDQSTGSENGLYVVAASGAPTRRSDADANAEVTGGLTVWVNEGTVNADTGWTLTTNDPIVVGTTALTFMQSGGAQVTVDSSLTKTGNQLGRAALTGDVTASAGSNTTTIANSAVTLAKMANLASGKILGNLSGSTAAPIAVDAVATATASTVVARDANANVKNNSTASGVATTATAAGTTTLTVGSAQFQQFTGSTTQVCVLPDATTLVTGQSFIISNQSSGAVQVNANGGGGVRSVAALTTAVITLIAAGSAAGTWDPGTTASATGLATSNFVTRETPSGTVNGSNTAFTLANTPTSGTDQVYLNGLLQEPGGQDYTLSGTTITFVSAPVSGDRVRCSYMK